MERSAGALKEGQYLAIESPVDHEITVQRSRFIASLRFAKDRTQFDHEMAEIVRTYPKATHHCWAYRFNDTIVLEHASDAGEPSGTAGRPILGALKKFSLLNMAAVVTRYYGGIKLGVRGLIAAYSQATIQAIEAARIIVNEPRSLIRFAISYDLYNLLLSRLENNCIPPSSVHAAFDESISGEIIVPHSLLANVTKDLESIASGKPNFTFSTTALDD